MEVILMERVEKLGQMGDVVTVKPGFARNFLLPRGKALRASETNKKVFEAQRAQLEAHNLEQKTEAEAVGEKMDGTKVTLIRQAGEAGQLYGSANARDISNALTEDGFTVNRNQVKLAAPIKTIGLHDVPVNLHPEVAVTVTVNIGRTAEEAEIQAETGVALIAAEVDAQEEAAEKAQAAADAAADQAAAEEAEAEDGDDAEVEAEGDDTAE